MEQLNGKDIININGLYYYVKDIQDNINDFGQSIGHNYKDWTKAGKFAITDANELFGELKDNILEYNGSYFIDHQGRDRNNPKNKKNLTKGSSYNGGEYRTAGATILSYAIKNATPINLGSEDDFRKMIKQQIEYELGNITDFQKLDIPLDGGDTYGIAKRYEIVANKLKSIKDNLGEYGILYNIPKDFEKKLDEAYGAFADGTINNDEGWLLNRLFIGPNEGISSDYFKTDFSVPKTEEPVVEEKGKEGGEPIIKEEEPIIKEDSSKIYEFKYNFSETDNDIYSSIVNKLNNDNIADQLEISFYKDHPQKSKFLEILNENKLNFEIYVAYLWNAAVDKEVLKRINSTNEYYCPFIKKDESVLVYKRGIEDKTAPCLKWKKIKDIPNFNEN